jgi:preprotein translocase subunit YajC
MLEALDLVSLAPHAPPTDAALVQDGAQASTEAPGSPAGAGEGTQEAPSFFWPMLAILGIFWFVMIGPERKRKKQREEMLGGLRKGTKVMTTGGLYGTVVEVKDDVVSLQVADGVRLRFALQAIQGPAEGEAPAKGEAAKPKGKDAGGTDPETGAAS